MRRTTVILVLLGILTFLAGLGRPAIGDSDEAFYAEAGREMVESGDWLTPRYNYELRFQKPVLYYWLVAGTYAAAGVGEAAARFWSALAGIGLALLTAAVGRAWYNERTALLGGAVVASAFGYFSIGRLALPDLPLAFFITLATWAAVHAMVDAVRFPSRWLALSGVAIGLGFLTKGPVGALIPALVILPIWWLERHHAVVPRGGVLAGLALAATIGAPWYIAMALVHGQPYLESFFIGDNLDRFVTTRFNEPRPFWFYGPIVLGGMLPWTPLFACGVPDLVAWLRGRVRLDRVTLRLLLWSVLPLLFFTLSVGKQPRYILPVLPPLALLLVRGIERHRERHEAAGSGRDRVTRGATLSIGLLLMVLGVLLYRSMPVIVMVDPTLVTAGAVLIGTAGLGVLLASLRVPGRHLPLAVALAGALALVGLQYGLSPAGRDPVQVMAAHVLRHRQADEPVATYRVFVRNLVFYTHVPSIDLPTEDTLHAFLSHPERVLLVIAADELAALRSRGDVPVRSLAEVLYFNASAVKLRTLLSPDPSRDLERVLLVTNR